jgi:pimeloyl-ACP methyl ester carboxylesterase
MTGTSSQEKQASPATAIDSLRLKTGNNSIHYLKAGSGPPVLLLHGGACDSSDWIETMTALADRYTFYAPDLLGYGQSDKNEDGYLISDFANSIMAFTDALGIEHPFMIGHSLGGRVCLDIALNHPESIRKLILIDTAGFSRLALWGSFLGTAAWAIRRVLKRPQPYPRFLAEAGGDFHWRCLDRMPGLKVSTLIIWSRHDPYYSLDGAVKAKKMAPQVELKVFPGYGHAPHRKHRELFHNLILGFLPPS